MVAINRGGQRGRPVVPVPHDVGPPAGTHPHQPAQRLHRVVPLEQDLERVEEADVEQPDDLLDEVTHGRHAT